MNICLVSNGFFPEDCGGIGTYAKDLSLGLKALGHEVFIITNSSSNDKQEEIEGVHVYRFKTRFLPKLEGYFPGIVWSLFVANKINQLDRIVGFDIIEFPNWEGVGLIYNLFLHKKPTVTRLHTPYFETLYIDKNGHRNFPDNFICYLEYRSCKKSNALTCSTTYHRHIMAEQYSINEDSIKIIPLGIDLFSLKVNFFDKKAQKDENLKVLYVSRLEKRKGTLTLIKAIPAVLNKNPNTKFIIVGKDRPHAPGNIFFKDYFKENYGDLINNVTFLGHVSNEQLYKFYQECDIFVVPSLYESFGLIYTEAMRFAKPVIGCQAGGIPEVVVDGKTGYLVPPDNADILADKIVELLRNQELRSKMGEEGFKLVKLKFSRERMAIDTSNFYKEVMLKRGN